MRAFDRDLIRGGHYGQRSRVPRIKGRTHGCTDQACDVKILLANLEPSTHGTKLTCQRRVIVSAIGATADLNCLRIQAVVACDRPADFENEIWNLAHHRKRS